MNVTLIDQKDEILKKSKNDIGKSLQRVVKKKFPDDTSVIMIRNFIFLNLFT